MSKAREKSNSIKNIIGLYQDGDITFGEMIHRISIKPTLKNTILIGLIIAAIATTKDVVIKNHKPLLSFGPTTTNEELQQIEIEILIKKGDSLTEIAERFGTTSAVLAKYNGIENPNNIKAGKTIKILLPLETVMDIIETYTVKQGDTFESICKDNKITAEEFVALNPDKQYLMIGDEVNVLKRTATFEYRPYLIQEGDSPISICEEFGMDLEHFYTINDYNPDSYIYAGDVAIFLCENAIYKTYEVKKNETIQDVANKFDVRVEDIMKLNEITEVIPGEKITIPSRIEEKTKVLGLF